MEIVNRKPRTRRRRQEKAEAGDYVPVVSVVRRAVAARERNGSFRFSSTPMFDAGVER
jgi:hypothetical protein